MKLRTMWKSSYGVQIFVQTEKGLVRFRGQKDLGEKTVVTIKSIEHEKCKNAVEAVVR